MWDISVHDFHLNTFEPGYLPQDILTLSLEATAVYGVSNYLEPPKNPRWPFENESNYKIRAQTRHSTDFLIPVLAAIHTPIFLGLTQQSEAFSPLSFIRGLAHTHLITELFTISSKKWFGRHRPFYDTEINNSSIREDDKLSFFSGHASHAMASTIFSVNLVNNYVQNPYIKWPTCILLTSAGLWISSTRAIDNQHHWSDVVAGMVVGSSVATWVAQKNIAVNSNTQVPSQTSYSLGYDPTMPLSLRITRVF